ncbi:hypothetical protein SK237_16120 [Novacetimonas hansenii]|uniref:hypothetical protein n=2 Tax=Novacetimonas hansenii TaxID=436 RepID=UPI0011420D36
MTHPRQTQAMQLPGHGLYRNPQFGRHFRAPHPQMEQRRNPGPFNIPIQRRGHQVFTDEYRAIPAPSHNMQMASTGTVRRDSRSPPVQVERSQPRPEQQAQD